ncbi:DUF4205 domain-containing protein [Chloropicon primus]|nr:DUF4205 domain-containing protein [Chloropicon primus]
MGASTMAEGRYGVAFGADRTRSPGTVNSTTTTTTTTTSSSSSVVLAEALVREYLHREGLKETLAAFDGERPRDGNSITNKNVLRKSLGLDRFAGRLKRKLAEDEKLPATLDMLVRYTLSTKKVAASSRSDPSGAARTAKQRPATARQSPAQDSGLRVMGRTTSTSSSRGVGVGPRFADGNGTGGEKPPKVSPVLGRPVGTAAFSAAASPPKPGATTSFLMDELKSMGARNGVGRDSGSMQPQKPRLARPSTAPPKPQRNFGRESEPSLQGESDLVIEDVDFDEDFSSSRKDNHGIDAAARHSSASMTGGFLSHTSCKPGLPSAEDVDISTARRLKTILLGKDRTSPPPSWVQGFYFSDNPRLRYGIVQEEGGPCGVLAAVQASVLDALMESLPDVEGWVANPELVSDEVRAAALAKALARMLKQVTTGSLKIVTSGSSVHSEQGLSFSEYMNSLEVYAVGSTSEAERTLRSLMGKLSEKKGYGLISFVLSVALTRGVTSIGGDMDDPSCGLIGGYGYCTQDLVNLLLSGRAATNVFDGNMALDESTTLKGVKARSRCGFLTIFEWYKHLKVGSNLKDPYKPIWVVNSESHFSVLFASDMKCSTGESKLSPSDSLDLYYYDELANQDDIIKLTVRPSRPSLSPAFGDNLSLDDEGEDEDRPPLEKVIETRWPKVTVDWNGSEPIL